MAKYVSALNEDIELTPLGALMEIEPTPQGLGVGDTVLYWATAPKDSPVTVIPRAAIITALRSNNRYDITVFNPNGMSNVSRIEETTTQERGKITRKA